jgi:hypothetical protein
MKERERNRGKKKRYAMTHGIPFEFSVSPRPLDLDRHLGLDRSTSCCHSGGFTMEKGTPAEARYDSARSL